MDTETVVFKSHCSLLRQLLTCCGAEGSVSGCLPPLVGPVKGSGFGWSVPPGPWSSPCHWGCSASAGDGGARGCAGERRQERASENGPAVACWRSGCCRCWSGAARVGWQECSYPGAAAVFAVAACSDPCLSVPPEKALGEIQKQREWLHKNNRKDCLYKVWNGLSTTPSVSK